MRDGERVHVARAHAGALPVGPCSYSATATDTRGGRAWPKFTDTAYSTRQQLPPFQRRKRHDPLDTIDTPPSRLQN